jgi:tRNA(Ile)-lysidine synthase
VRNGDRFVPFGMKGSKLVSDYLTDRHRSLIEKRRQTVVEDADGRIVWLVGERTDNRFRVSEATTEVLVMTLTQND